MNSYAPSLSLVRISKGKNWWTFDDELMDAIKASGSRVVHNLDDDPPFAIVGTYTIPAIYEYRGNEAFDRLEVRPAPKRYGPNQYRRVGR